MSFTCPLPRSHTLTRLSHPPLINSFLPLMINTLTICSCPVRVLRHWPVVVFQTLIERSRLPLMLRGLVLWLILKLLLVVRIRRNDRIVSILDFEAIKVDKSNF